MSKFNLSLSQMCKFGYNQCLVCRSLDIDTKGEFARCRKCGSLRVKNHPGIPGFEDAKNTARKCVNFKCEYAPLVYLKVGESLQTKNGFLICKINGWYCPVCAGGYGKGRWS